jgi:hypothetical protein
MVKIAILKQKDGAARTRPEGSWFRSNEVQGVLLITNGRGTQIWEFEKWMSYFIKVKNNQEGKKKQ